MKMRGPVRGPAIVLNPNMLSASWLSSFIHCWMKICIFSKLKWRRWKLSLIESQSCPLYLVSNWHTWWTKNTCFRYNNRQSFDNWSWFSLEKLPILDWSRPTGWLTWQVLPHSTLPSSWLHSTSPPSAPPESHFKVRLQNSMSHIGRSYSPWLELVGFVIFLPFLTILLFWLGLKNV